MLFHVLLAFSISKSDKPSFTFRTAFQKEFSLENPQKYLNRNINKISSFITHIFNGNKKDNGSNGEWYYVHFMIQNYSSILKMLNIDEKNEIIKDTYTMFLSEKQIDIISNISLIANINPNDKIFEETWSIDETNLFSIITTDGFKLPITNYYIVEKRYNNNSFIIKIKTDAKKEKMKIIKQIADIPQVRSIITYKEPNFKNSIASGFTQKNSFNFTIKNNYIYKLDRYINEKGLNGENQIITILDTPIDFYHSMFRDDNVQIELNKYLPNHRKIIYYGHKGTMDHLLEIMEDGEHGTHTSGTAAGKSICSNNVFDTSVFNGNAPEAKIIYVGGKDDVEDYERDFINIMNKYGSKISSNSWGSTDYDSNMNYQFGKYAYKNPQSVFIYAAGNEYYELEGNFSVCDPGGSKNVLTVSAIGSPYIPEVSGILLISHEYEFKYELDRFFGEDIEDDFWHLGIIGIDPEKSDILFVNASLGNQCELIAGDVVSVIYGDSIEWVYDCEYTKIKNVFYFNNEKLAKQIIDNGGVFSIQRYHIINPNTTIERMAYSSTGPANKGILKPDVMAPGEQIISAKSREHSNSPHGCQEGPFSDYLFMTGTSMSTPNVAGGMALVHQYFNSGKWIEKVNLDGATSRALIINSAKHPRGSKVPDLFFGHGVVDLSTILPFENDFGVQITHQEPNNKHEVSQNGHVIAKLIVNSNANKKNLQITLSYLDPLLNIESPIPLTRDLDIIVISPSKKVFIGDHLSSKDTQHASTNEKIIIDENEVEIGEYEIHVYGGDFADNIGSSLNLKQDFAVVATGPIESKYLEFEDSNTCLCDKCDKDHPGYCICDKNKNIGQFCQVDIQTVNGNKGSFSVGPLEIKRVRFVADNNIESIVSKSSNPGRSSTIWASTKCHLSLSEYEVNGETGNETEPDKTIHIGFKSKEICIAIFNFNDVDSIYDIEITVMAATKIDNVISALTSVIVVLSILLLVAVIVIIILCIKAKICKCCKKSERSDKSLLDSSLA